ncbi:MAG: hypothetical protein ACPGWR_07395 [Ardenticatenaceae bacterium]
MIKPAPESGQAYTSLRQAEEAQDTRHAFLPPQVTVKIITPTLVTGVALHR